jgi:hypothetical protein
VESAPDRIKPSELNWSQPWFVILNGCGTVACSPDALSLFIRVAGWHACDPDQSREEGDGISRCQSRRSARPIATTF